MTRRGGWLLATLALLAMGGVCRAQIQTIVELNDDYHASSDFSFKKVPPPSKNDAATDAKFSIVYGDKDPGANDVNRLHDGKLPTWDDQPGKNFSFHGDDGGRLLVDLGRAIDIAQVNTYSWHPKARGCQLYKLYVADGVELGLNPRPPKGIDPTTCGWRLIASIDTRPKRGDEGGQFGVSIFDSSGLIGHDRYLLFDMKPTELADGWGNTFYSEIDVIERGGPRSRPIVAPAPPLPPPDPPGDPMDWNPHGPAPELRKRYGPRKYAELAKAALAKIDVAALRDPTRPTRGMLVEAMEPQGPGAALGIKPGDIIMSVDGVPVGAHAGETPINAARTDSPQQLTLWSPGKGEKTLTIQPGRLGFFSYDGWRPSEAYVRSNNRDPRWDDDLLIATNEFVSDPELAETALAIARDKGYRGALLKLLPPRIAYYDVRFEDALVLGQSAWMNGKSLSPDAVHLYYDAACFCFKQEQALNLAARYPNVLGDQHDLAAVIASYRAMPKSDLSDPIAEIKNVRRVRDVHFGALKEGQDPEFFDYTKSVARDFSGGRSIDVNVESGHYYEMALTPAIPDLSLRVRFAIHDTDKEITDYAHSLTFLLFDVTPAVAGVPRGDALSIVVTTDGYVWIDAFGLPQLTFQLPPPRGRSNHLEGTFRIAILHNRCEVLLDDRRLFYGPVVSDESKRRYALLFRPVGVAGRISAPLWERLDDRRTKGKGK